MILVLDTATERLHLALVDGTRAWTWTDLAGPGRSHSVLLLPALNHLMAEAGARPRDLTGVVACVGPGGFTALRLGVATAEGLALTGLPAWGFSAFELRARALDLAGHMGPRWILLDGQRREAFLQRWNGRPTTDARKLPLQDLPLLIQGEAWWAPAAFLPLLRPRMTSDPLPLPNESSATLDALVALGRERPAVHAPEAPLVPFYLRETDAELNFPEASGHLTEALSRGLAR